MCKTYSYIAALATAVGLLIAGAPSIAAPLSFTWNPGGASPALGGGAFTADTTHTTSFLFDVAQPDGTGAAHQLAVVTGFSLGGSAVTPAGFGTSYGLYFDIMDTHISGPPPEIIRFSSVEVALKADPGNQNGPAFATVGGVGFANTGATGQADDITLATGSLVSSSTNLNVVTGVLDVRQVVTFQPSAGQAGFFSGGSSLLEIFSSNPANFTSTPQDDGTTITTFNDFSNTAQFVPEPGSAPLLLMGLLGLLPLMRRG